MSKFPHWVPTKFNTLFALILTLAAKLHGATPSEIEARYKAREKEAEAAREAIMEQARKEASDAFQVLEDEARAAGKSPDEIAALQTQLRNIYAGQPLNLGIKVAENPSEMSSDLAQLAGEWQTNRWGMNIRFIFADKKVTIIESFRDTNGLAYSRTSNCKVTTKGNSVVMEPTKYSGFGCIRYTLELPFNFKSPVILATLGQGSLESQSPLGLVKVLPEDKHTVENPSTDYAVLQGDWEIGGGFVIKFSRSKATVTRISGNTKTEHEYRVKTTPTLILLESKDKNDPMRYEIPIPFDSLNPLIIQARDDDESTVIRSEIRLSKKQ
jgi:hypothetical protein